MKPLSTLAKLLVVGLWATLFMAPGAFAFHKDGVARCEACHVMHNSEDGRPVTNEQGEYLLQRANPTDLCLMCHGPDASSFSVMSSDYLNPAKKGKGAGGGDFVFLKEDNLNDSPNGTSGPMSGDWAGHNIIGTGLSPDSRYSTAPGGTYPSNKLTCTSCHDPHGNTNYRFLYGSSQGRAAKSLSLGYSFSFSVAAPVALEMPLGATEDDNSHNAYKSGMSDWCEACHGRRVHDDHHGSGFEHPGSHSLEGERRNNYNSYNGTLDPNNGGLAHPYLAMVPVEWNSTTNSTTYTGPVDSQARVMCLSCHRAHASSGPHSGRWDFNIVTWADEGSSGSYPIQNPYAASSGNQQRRLCEKCHGLNIPD